MNRWMTVMVCVLALSVGLDYAATTPMMAADEPTLDLNSPDVIKSVLEQQVGKRVKIKLDSGQDVEGKVAKVGAHAVQLTELTGMDYFDATVKLDDIAAVIVRVRTK